MKREKLIQELERMAKDIQERDEQMAEAVRESGRKTQEGLEDLVRTVHRMHNLMIMLPGRMRKISEELRKS